MPTDQKAQYVQRMFDHIAPRYDIMNRLMTGGMDVLWRHRVIEHLSKFTPHSVLDIACGTGDMVVMMAHSLPSVTEITGVDLSEGMLAHAKRRIAKLNTKAKINLRTENAEALPFADQSFDAITCTLGIRNFSHPDQGLREMRRLLRPGGTLAILELSEPSNRILHAGYNIFAKRVIPFLGKTLARDAAAYTYLPKSISAMPQRQEFARMMREAGFRLIHYSNMPLGVCVLYTAEV